MLFVLIVSFSGLCLFLYFDLHMQIEDRTLFGIYMWKRKITAVRLHALKSATTLIYLHLIVSACICS